MIEVVCPTPDSTRSLGRRLASLLHPGDIVLLKGRLGTGKTVFAGGVAEGLGVQEHVTSPTFVLARWYDGLMPFVHADVYRLGSSAEIEDLDLPDEAAGGVLVVEWGDVAEKQFGEDHLLVEIEAGPDEVRTICLRPHGSWEGRPLEELTA
ncbi:MAG: tRNA (adenosine(37)-N6)-threonylcarbamoyltransferase complex ATPase subunit type 1 TsaE [Acidimicrobiia bacterium]